MAAEMQIDYFTPEFEQFRKDVLSDNLKGVVVTKLDQWSPPMAEDFNHNGANQSKIDSADIVITITQPNVPAMIVGKSDQGKRFLKMRKYAILK